MSMFLRLFSRAPRIVIWASLGGGGSAGDAGLAGKHRLADILAKAKRLQSLAQGGLDVSWRGEHVVGFLRHILLTKYLID